MPLKNLNYFKTFDPAECHDIIHILPKIFQIKLVKKCNEFITVDDGTTFI